MSVAWDEKLIKGELAQNAEKYDEAERLFKEALPEAEGFAPEDPRLSFLLRLMAGNCVAQGRLQEAEPFMRRSVEACERSSDRATAEFPKVVEQYAKLLGKLGRAEESKAQLKRAQELKAQAGSVARQSWAGAATGWTGLSGGKVSDKDASGSRKEGTAEQGKAEPAGPQTAKDGTAEQGVADHQSKGLASPKDGTPEQGKVTPGEARKKDHKA